MIKSVHVVESLDNSYGGPAKSVPSLLHGLIECGSEGALVSTDMSDSRNSVVDEYGLTWLIAPRSGPSVFRYSSALVPLLRNEIGGASVVHLHSLWTYPTYAAFKVAKGLGRPVLLSARSSLYESSLKKSRVKKTIARNLFVDDLLKSVACVHATSEDEAEEISKLGLRCPIVVVPNGVDVEEPVSDSEKEESRRVLGLDSKKCYLVFFSRIHPRKGLDKLIDSWIALSSIFVDVDVLVAGPIDDQRYFSLIQRKVEEYGLSARFHFFGMVSGAKRRQVLAASDLFVLPTKFENFGMAIGEALSLGLPVVTTTGTPWREIQTHDCGWWFSLEDDLLSDVLTKALSSRESFESMGRRGRSLIQSSYAWSAKAECMLSVYKWMNEGADRGCVPYEFKLSRK